MDVVPQFWLLTRRAQSRIFQQLTVPDILKKVLQGLDVDVAKSKGPFTRVITACSTAKPTSTSRSDDGRRRASTTSSSTPTAATRWWWRTRPQSHADRARPAARLSTRTWKAAPRTRTAFSTGRRRRNCARASTPCGTTASSCRTSTWRRRKTIQESVAGRQGDAQAQARRQRPAGAVRFPGRIRPAVRRHRHRAAVSGRRTCRRSSKTTSGPSRSACRRRRLPGSSIRGGEQLPAVRLPGTSSPCNATSTPTGRTC